MNRKGFTLIEVLCSIMMLSIIGTMLATAFGKVIYFMDKSNTVKNESNALYAYTEGTDDTAIRNSVIQNDKQAAYKIDSISVSGTLSEFHSKKTDEITLKQFYSDNTKKLKEFPNYQNLVGFSKEMKEQLIKLQADDELKNYILIDGLNAILKKLYQTSYSYQFDIFPSSLLPTKINKAETYIRALYPWEQGGRDLVTSGGCLIYATQQANGSISSINEKIYLVYDPVSAVWYYNGDSSNTYVINYNVSYPLFDKNNYTTNNTFFEINGNRKMVESWSELLEHIKDDKNGWKQLDAELVYNANESIDNYWVKVKK